MDNEERRQTRYLNEPVPEAKPMPDRVTGPLDDIIPWVIEFRVVGTHHIIKVPVKEVMVVGRADPKNNIQPDIDLTPYAAQALGVSRQHAIITVKNNRINIADYQSPNGTYINDNILAPKQEYRLRDGDKLRFGRLHLQVHFVVKPTASDATQEFAQLSNLDIPRLVDGQLALVVDDDQEVAHLIQLILQRSGYTVAHINSVTDAIIAFDERRPNIIISELLLPDRSGLELVRYVRSKAEQQNRVAIMIVSAATAGYQMGQALEEGVDIFLGKPFAVDEFVRGIKKLVELTT